MNNISSNRRRQRSLVALAWLISGTALLTLTPLQAHTPTLGWAPLLWLVGAPALMLLLLQPQLPMRLLMRPRSSRRPLRRRAR